MITGTLKAIFSRCRLLKLWTPIFAGVIILGISPNFGNADPPQLTVYNPPYSINVPQMAVSGTKWLSFEANMALAADLGYIEIPELLQNPQYSEPFTISKDTNVYEIDISGNKVDIGDVDKEQGFSQKARLNRWGGESWSLRCCQ